MSNNIRMMILLIRYLYMNPNVIYDYDSHVHITPTLIINQLGIFNTVIIHIHITYIKSFSGYYRFNLDCLSIMYPIISVCLVVSRSHLCRRWLIHKNYKSRQGPSPSPMIWFLQVLLIFSSSYLHVSDLTRVTKRLHTKQSK